MLLGFLLSNIQHFSYIGIAVSIGLTSLGAPFPEEAVLLLTGYFVFKGVIFLGWAILAALIGVLIGDYLAYYIGFRKGMDFFKFWGKKFKIIGRNLNKVLYFFDKHHSKSIFFGRFLMGIRFLVPFIAGSLKVPAKKFFIYNFLGAVIWVPFVIILGSNLGAVLDIAKESRKIKEYVYLILIFVLVIYKVISWLRAKYANHKEEADFLIDLK